MKVVVVSQRIDSHPERTETRDALDQRLTTFVGLCGYLSVPVPNNLDGAIHDWLTTINPAAVILSGGNNIGEYLERDATEAVLLSFAKGRELPLLGICRGMQMMACWAGTGLHPVRDHVRTRHNLSGEIACEVNSYHNLSLVRCPDDFEVLARSEDGEIEAIRHQYLPWEGWMWHPEREESFADRDVQRIKALFCG